MTILFVIIDEYREENTFAETRIHERGEQRDQTALPHARLSEFI